MKKIATLIVLSFGIFAFSNTIVNSELKNSSNAKQKINNSKKNRIYYVQCCVTATAGGEPTTSCASAKTKNEACKKALEQNMADQGI